MAIGAVQVIAVPYIIEMVEKEIFFFIFSWTFF
jgi:hypothetical protein